MTISHKPSLRYRHGFSCSDELRRAHRKMCRFSACFESVLVLMLCFGAVSCSTTERGLRTEDATEEVHKLILHINEDYDILHTEFTPAVHKLRRRGIMRKQSCPKSRPRD